MCFPLIPQGEAKRMVLKARGQSLPPSAAILPREAFPSATPTWGEPPAWKVSAPYPFPDLESGLFGPVWGLSRTSRWVTL